MKKYFALVIIVIFCMISVVSCGKEELPNDWAERKFIIDGVMFSYPYNMKMFEKCGFTLNEDLMKERPEYVETLEPDEGYFWSTTLNHKKYDNAVSEEDLLAGIDKKGKISVSFINRSDETKKTTKCDIFSIELENRFGTDIVDGTIPFELAGGITMGSSLEEIIAAWGEPESIDDYTVFVSVLYQRDSAQVILRINPDSGLYSFVYY